MPSNVSCSVNLESLREDAFRISKKINMRYTHVCYIYHKGKLISKGHNQFKKVGKNSIHAEIMAMRKIPPWIDPQNCTMIVVRVNRNGEFRQSKPCMACERAIFRKKVGVVIHS